MPDMNGYEVCQHLKASEQTNGIPVIFISALSEVFDKVKAFAVGGVDYITKPFQFEEVLVRVENQLRIRSLSKQLEQKNAQLEQEIRDRILAQEALSAAVSEAARSAAELRALFAAMSELIIVYDAQGRCLKIAPTNPLLLYKPGDELIGKTLHEVFEQNQADTFLGYIQQAITTKQTVNFEYSLTIKEQELWFATSVSPISEDSAIWVARDITERKQAEKALWEKEQVLRLVLDNIPQQIFWKDTNLVFQGCNKNWAKSAQLDSPDAVVGLTDYDLLPNREIAEQFRVRDRHVIETNTPESHVVESKQKTDRDGQAIWLDVNRIPIHDKKGNVIGILGALEDITQRKRAEEALRLSEEKFSKAFRSSPDPITISTLTDGRFIEVNESFLSIVGCSREEVIGYTAAELNVWLHIGERNSFRTLLQEQGVVRNQEFEFRIKSGEVRTGLLSAEIINLEGQECILSVITDITERKRALDAIQESQRQLRNQNTVLVELAKNQALYRGDLKAASREITEAAARTLEIERASIWLYDDTDSNIQCIDLFEQSINLHSEGTELAARNYPAYFNALEEDRALAAHDAHNDSRTREFSKSYLTPLGINSMLDTPIRLGGHTIGVICLELLGRAREWTLEEQNFAGSLADLVSLAIEAQRRKRAEIALQQAEEKYRSIFENAAEGIFQSTFDGYYLSVNPALARMYGYLSPEELIANLTNIEQQLYVHPNRRVEFIAAMEEYDAVSNFEAEVCRKDSSIIWVSENARTVRDANGNLLYYEGTVQDITLRKQAEEALRVEQEKSERLLLNILPKAIADQLKQYQGSLAEQFDEATILFADIVGFTPLSAKMPPIQLVNLLNQIFSTFDQLAEQHGIEKIKTLGDAYMVAGGLPMVRPDHAEAVAEMALDMQREITRFHQADGEPFRLRIGINTGSVVAGVIGIRKFIYDLWGDAVNVASRMESQGIAGGIQVTASTYERLKDKYWLEKRGEITIKGKGKMMTYWLTGRKDE
jgi:PAS domain S-box-containing protein